MPRAKHVTVKALAGTGKTTTMAETFRRGKGIKSGLKGSDEQEAIWKATNCTNSAKCGMMAFNSSIKEEWKGLGIPGLEVHSTFGFGLKVLKMNGVAGAFEEKKSGLLLDSFAPNLTPKQVYPIIRLCQLARLTLTENDFEQLDILAAHNMIDISQEGIDHVQTLLELHEEKLDLIDYTDMVWLPYRLGKKIRPFDFLGVDECLPGWTPVMLADGSSKTIKEIVDEKLDVSVRSWDVSSGVQKNCKVIGWQKLLNQKPLVKVRVKQSRRTGTNYKHNFVICTTDHRILTKEHGWVQAGDIKVGDTVIVETAAITTQRGKITSSGKDVLSTQMAGNKKRPKSMRKGFKGTRGGNGHGLTVPERTLLEALGTGWVGHYAIPTGGRKTGLPTCYKLDLANPELKIAVEVDGHSHKGRKEQDAIKEQFLTENGWKVFRFNNVEAVQTPLECVCKITGNCPIPATVVSVEPFKMKDYYVYDITVEDCHNFYANGILVHNCQDLNAAQQHLILKHANRFLMVGDERQAIYQFAGADEMSYQHMQEELSKRSLGMIELPLTISRRCCKAATRLAQEIVPEFKCLPNAKEGSATELSYDDWQQDMRGFDPDHMIIARNNEPVVTATLSLLRMRKPARMIGRAFGNDVEFYIKRLSGPRSRPEDVRRKIADDLVMMREKWAKQKYITEQVTQEYTDVARSAMVFCEMCSSLEEVFQTIQTVFIEVKDNPKGVIRLSTIHRAKGLEARHIHFLESNTTGVPYRLRKRVYQPKPSDVNLRYIAITRTQESLSLVQSTEPVTTC